MLILNADDFGLTPGINRAIAELHAAGALTSATLMAAGPAFDDAVAIARANPSLGIGCHIVLTDGTPISPPETIPTLLDPNSGPTKTFRPKLTHFLRDLFLNRIDPSDIAREAHAQIIRLQSHGIHPTHIDTHKHTHIFPSIARPLLEVCELTGVRAVRNPFEPSWSSALGKTPLLRRLQLRVLSNLGPRFLSLPQIRSGTVLTTDGTVAISATGSLNSETLTTLLANLPEGIWELVCHPGYNDADLDAVATRLRTHRDIERQALLQALTTGPPPTPLINFTHLRNPYLP
jgi:predicted glycoside hydrolase/deacetylase ChbG (UPF0249 family)